MEIKELLCYVFSCYMFSCHISFLNAGKISAKTPLIQCILMHNDFIHKFSGFNSENRANPRAYGDKISCYDQSTMNDKLYIS